MQELSQYQPDLFIIYAGVNDLNFERNQEAAPGGQVAAAINRALYYRWSLLYTLLVEKMSAMRQGNPVPMMGQVDRSKEHFIENMSTVIRWCETHGVKVVVARQVLYAPPTLFLRDAASQREAQESLANSPHDPFGASYAPAPTLLRHVAIMRLLKELSAAHRIDYIDARPAMLEGLNRGEKLMYDYVHLSAAANDILAREIARHFN